VMEVDKTMHPSMLKDWFSTPRCKHQTNATSAAAAVAGHIIETSKPFDALQSLWSTWQWALPKSKDSSPSKWSKKKPRGVQPFRQH
jgi:hypothetical protein